MPSLVPINITSPLQVLLPQLLCFAVYHDEGGSDWGQEAKSIDEITELEALFAKLEVELDRSRRKNKELVDRNEQLQNQNKLLTTRNHKLEDQMVQLPVQYTKEDILSNFEEGIESKNGIVKRSINEETTCEDELRDTQREVKNALAEIARCRKQLNAKATEVTKALAEKAKCTNELNARTREVTNELTEKATCRNELNAKTTEVTKALAEKAKCTNELNDRTREVTNALAAKETCRNELNAKTAEVGNALAEKATCTIELNAKTVQLDEAITQAAICQENLNNTEVLKEMDLANRLLEASCGGRLDEVKILLKQNASMTSVNELGFTPILCAAFFAQLDTAKELLEAGANIMDLSPENETALHLVLERFHKENNPEQDDLAMFLIAKGADISARTVDGDLPLHIAAKHNRYKIVKVLLEAGQNVSIVDYYDNTPLHEATFCDALEVICLLMKYGANATASNMQDLTPLDLAKMKPDAKDYIMNYNTYIC